ncbi:NERD domain-containing protein [uncultured Nocardioides sp.]|uniref:NERD domain-containing protein n=1 Tax=uncultured Nocardioides sp. TaxID=198441 RepID=UPI002629EF51|nr:NERD domain-containing protein [uncultured Nocardioides sp.]
MVDVMGFVPVLADSPWTRWRSRAATPSRDAAGARATAAALSGLDPDRWHVLADWPVPGEPRAHVEHVVVGPPGVLVVDSKNWNGAVRTAQGVLRQDGSRRERDLAEAARTAGVVREALGLDEDVPVIGVLCFVPPAMVTGWIGEVLLCATGDVVAVLDRLTRRLDRDRVDDVAARLAPGVARRPALAPVEGQAGA